MNRKNKLLNTPWDAIVIGTGMGGASISYALAKAGKKVLILEKGLSLLSKDSGLRGQYAEDHFDKEEVPKLKHRSILQKSGRFFEEIRDTSAKKIKDFIPFIGSGTGGSSSLYGAVLERFKPMDFEPKKNFPHDRDSTLPKSWPFSYEDLVPYYKKAEDLFGITHAKNSLLDSMSPHIKEFSEELISQGLHPYTLPIGTEKSHLKKESQGYLCPWMAKNDSVKSCLKPAIELYGAILVDQCTVKKLYANHTQITGVECTIGGKEYLLKAKTIILAAGALETPKVLLQSKSPYWPEGLANSSGQVGRNLMRHFIDLMLIVPRSKPSIAVNHKEFGLNDFYAQNGHKYGSIQSFGKMPPLSMIMATLEEDLCKGTWLRYPFKLIKPFVRMFLKKTFAKSLVLASVMEDLPYKENRVSVSEDKNSSGHGLTQFQYSIHPHEKKRIAEFRQLIKKTFKKFKMIVIKEAENNERLAHCCGTCRSGPDPKTSVLNAFNQTHDLNNLYIVDSSFFPSSAGTNPGLTIAANALRVADHIVKTSASIQKASNHKLFVRSVR